MWLPPPTENNAQTNDERAAQPEDQTVTPAPTPSKTPDQAVTGDLPVGSFAQEFFRVLCFKRKWNIGTGLIVSLAGLLFLATLRNYNVAAAISIAIFWVVPGVLLSIPNPVYGSWAWGKKILVAFMTWLFLSVAFTLVGTMPTPEEVRQVQQTLQKNRNGSTPTPIIQKNKEPFDAIRQMHISLNTANREMFLESIAEDPENQRFARVQYNAVRSYIDLRQAIIRAYGENRLKEFKLKISNELDAVTTSPAQLKNHLDRLSLRQKTSVHKNRATVTIPGKPKPIPLQNKADGWGIDLIAMSGLENSIERSNTMVQMVVAARAMADSILDVGANDIQPKELQAKITNRLTAYTFELFAMVEDRTDTAAATVEWIDNHTGGPTQHDQTPSPARLSSQQAANKHRTTHKNPSKRLNQTSIRAREDFITGLDRWQRLQADADPGEQVISISNQKEIVIPSGPFEDRRELLDKAIDAQQYLAIVKYMRQQRKMSQPMAQWWQKQFAAGHVPLQMELALYYAKRDPKKAATCGVIAYIGATLDAELCADPSVTAAPRGLLFVYPKVQEILKQHAQTQAELNTTAVKWHQAHPNRPSPQWIGYRGARLFNTGRVELIPRDQWHAARARVLEKFQQDQPKTTQNTTQLTPQSQTRR